MNTIEAKITEIFSYGLIKGLGEPIPGHCCGEAAVCMALGEAHSEEPSCVSVHDRAVFIALNDLNWSSNAKRAEVLLPLAIAQLNTKQQDREEWAKLIVLGIIKKVYAVSLIKLKKFSEKLMKSKSLKNVKVIIKTFSNKPDINILSSRERLVFNYLESVVDSVFDENIRYAVSCLCEGICYVAVINGDRTVDRIGQIAVDVVLDAYHQTT